MSNDPYARKLGFLLHDVSRLMRRRFDRRAQTLGLTRAQWKVLLHLDRNAGATQATIAQLMDVQPITLARQIDRLEQDGWVERRAHPTDRRARCLYLTDKVHPMLDGLQQIASTIRAEAVVGIPDEDFERLLDMLERIKANLGALECAQGADKGASS